MINTILNTFFGNVRTLVAAGVSNAIRAGISDALADTTHELTLDYSGGPESIEPIELQELSLTDLRIE